MPESLTQTMQRYLQRYRTVLQPSTIAGKREAIQSVITALAQSHPQLTSWEQLQRLHIDAWLNHTLYLKPSTRIIRLESVNRFFNDLIAWRWPQAPPPALISPQDFPPRPFYLPKPLPPALDQALAEALASSPILAAHGLRLLRLTGMRIGEMLDLPLHCLTESGPSEFTLRVPIGKTRRERMIPVSAQTASLIHTILAQRPDRAPPTPGSDPTAHYLMIRPNGRRLSYSTCCRTLKKTARQISASENLHPHRLRHTFATEMARAQLPLPALMTLLGHQTPEMTMHYVQVATTDLQEAYQQALSRLPTLDPLHKRIGSPPPASDANLVPPSPSDLTTILIHRLESMRRDTSNPKTREQLQRLVKRLRRTNQDMKKLL